VNNCIAPNAAAWAVQYTEAWQDFTQIVRPIPGVNRKAGFFPCLGSFKNALQPNCR